MFSYLLYVSRIGEKEPPSTAAKILSIARTNNKLFGITGLLLFDGEFFAQYFEGSSAHVAQLWANLQADLRHQDVVLLDQGTAESRRFPTFLMGYVAEDHMVTGVLSKLQLQKGAEALSTFMETSENSEVA